MSLSEKEMFPAPLNVTSTPSPIFRSKEKFESVHIPFSISDEVKILMLELIFFDVTLMV